VYRIPREAIRSFKPFKNGWQESSCAIAVGPAVGPFPQTVTAAPLRINPF
jgi:hypothetical protein